MSIPGLSIPNVGEGHVHLSFDPDKPIERERAARIVTDLLRRVCAIAVIIGTNKQGNPITKRANAFDPNKCEYLIFGLSPEEETEIAVALGQPPPKKASRRTRYRVPAATTPAVAIARSARGCARVIW